MPIDDAANAQLLWQAHDRIGESPLWSVDEQALYWIDIEGRLLRRFDWAQCAVRAWRTDERIGSIALHDRGGFVAAMESGIFHLTLGAGEDAQAERLHAVTFPEPDMRFNDGRCDRAGRFWVTSMVRDLSRASPAGALYRMDGAGLLRTAVDGIVTGNGLAFGADGRTLLLSDSHASVQKVWRFELDAAGLPAKRQEYIDMRPHPGRPDGAAMDVEGGYWTCANDAGLVHRFLPDGRLDRSLRVPVAKPAMCAFGGPTLEHLFITSITPPAPIAGFDAAQDGALFVARPGVRGLAEVPFASRTVPSA